MWGVNIYIYICLLTNSRVRVCVVVCLGGCVPMLYLEGAHEHLCQRVRGRQGLSCSQAPWYASFFLFFLFSPPSVYLLLQHPSDVSRAVLFFFPVSHLLGWPSGKFVALLYPSDVCMSVWTFPIFFFGTSPPPVCMYLFVRVSVCRVRCGFPAASVTPCPRFSFSLFPPPLSSVSLCALVAARLFLILFF